MTARAIIGVDIGGTFTDLVLVRPAAGVVRHKLLTTPDDPARAVLDGAAELLASTGTAPAAVAAVVHSTTLVTNAIIERRGAPVGLLATAGFSDQLDFGNEQRYDIHDLFLVRPDPLAPRSARREIDARRLADGTVVTPLDPAAAVAAAEDLIASGVEAIAIALLHAYRWPDDELAARAAIAERFPELPVSLSAEVAPILGEYDRTTTTTADAYVKPLVTSYLDRLACGLAALGVPGPLRIVLSSGVVGSLAVARERPIRLVESGPAAGAVASAYYSRQFDLPELLAFDMGGTTAKACLVSGGEPDVGAAIEVARVHRFKPGSGLPLAVPSVDLLEIGAGGGSIARVDSLGLLKVGPESAGADPGPACYGRGGDQPTVTDADLLLGYLDPDHFLAGRLRLDVEAARRAVGMLAERLGLSRVDAARGVHDVVCEQMAQAARAHVIGKNRDPRSLPLVAFGGAGPVHAVEVARRLGIRRIACPPGAGTMAALGCLAAPFGFDVVRAFPGRLDRLDWPALNRLLDQAEATVAAALRSAGVDSAAASFARQVDLRIVGQVHQVAVPAPAGALDAGTAPLLAERFAAQYAARYSRRPVDQPVESVVWRVLARVSAPALPAESAARPSGEARVGERPAWFAGGWRSTPVYLRERLAPGTVVAGPAIVAEAESTAVLPPDARGTIAADGTLWIDLGGADAAH